MSDTEIIKTDSLSPQIAEPQRIAPVEPGVTDTKFFTLPEQEELEASGRTAGAPANSTLTSLKQFMRDQELTYINRALSQSSGDKEKAAQILGVSLATLYRRLSSEE